MKIEQYLKDAQHTHGWCRMRSGKCYLCQWIIHDKNFEPPGGQSPTELCAVEVAVMVQTVPYIRQPKNEMCAKKQ